MEHPGIAVELAQLGGAPLPVRGPLDLEVVGHARVVVDRGGRHGGGLVGARRSAQIDALGGGGTAQQAPVVVVRETCHERGSVPEPRQPDGDVERATAGRLAVFAARPVGHQVDERLADHREDWPHVTSG